MKAKLGDVCNFYAGTGFPVVYQGKDCGELPFYKVGDIANNVNAGKIYLEFCNNYISREDAQSIKGVIIPKGTVVFAKIGEALKLNRRAISNCDCLIDNNAMGIAPKNEILREKYFFYYMKNLKMQELAESTTVPSVRKSKLESIIIDIPNIQEQQNIERQLDKISEIINNRKQQLQELDELVKARFVEMFGDPITNTKELTTKNLKDVLVLKAGDFTAASDIVDEPTKENKYPCYGGNGIRGYVAEYNQEGEYSLVGRQGALSGNVQYATGKFKNTEHALLVTPTIKMNSIWLNHLLINLDLKRYQTGAAQPGLSVKNLQEIQIIIVPIELQNEFADFVKQVDKSKFAVQKALDEAQTLFDSLMQEYFG